MSLSKYTIPQINWIESCLISSLLFFFLPIGIVLIGYFWIQKRKINNKPTKLVKIIITISELIALIPIIGITFFAEDGAIYLFFLPITIIISVLLLIPIIIPILCFIVIKERKAEKLIKPIIGFAISEPIFLALDIWFIYIF